MSKLRVISHRKRHKKACTFLQQPHHRRWIRLLFGREMGMDDLFVLWDVLFADSPRLALVEYIAVAMLTAVRDRSMFV